MTGRPHSGSARAIGIDVGGSKVAAAVVTDTGEILGEQGIATPSSRDTALARTLADLVEKLWAEHGPVDAVGVGIAGLVEWPTGRVRYATNHDHRRTGIRDLLSAALADGPAADVPIVVDNDANCAALAETVRPDARDLLFVAIGTGVGSGILLDRRLFRGRDGMGGEIGHVLVQSDGPRCACGRIGCLEAVASAKALAVRAARVVEKDPRGHLGRLAGSGRVTPRLAMRAALEGDVAVQRLVRSMGRAVAVAVESAHALMNFDEIIIGGGVGDLGELLLAPLRQRLARQSELSKHLPPPQVRPSVHGAASIVVGAGLLALSPDSAAASSARRPLAGASP